MKARNPFEKAIRGRNQAEIARQLKVHRSYITRLRTGERHPTLAFAYQLSALLGVPVEELFPPQKVL